MRRKYLIAFTGIDGSGKTTQAKLLLKRLQNDNMEVSFIRSKWEPFFIRPIIKKWKGREVKNTSDSKNGSSGSKKRKTKNVEQSGFT